MAHIRLIILLVAATTFLSGCYTQIHVTERPGRHSQDFFTGYADEQSLYDLGYDDGFYDARLYFRDYSRYQWSLGYHHHYHPYRSFSRLHFGFSYGLHHPHAWHHGWGWHDPWHYHYGSPFGWHANPWSWYGSPWSWHSNFYRYPAYGWGGSTFYGPNYFVVYNFQNITGTSPHRTRVVRGTGSITGTRSSDLAGRVVRSPSASRGVTTAASRGEAVTRTQHPGAATRVDRSLPAARSAGTVTRSAPSQTRGVRPASTTTRSTQGSVNRTSSAPRSTGSVTRSSGSSSTQAAPSRSSSTSRSSGTTTRSSGGGSSDSRGRD